MESKGLRTDSELMSWVSFVGRWITPQERHHFQSRHFPHRTVHFYVHGRYMQVDGDDTRQAINKAIDVYEDLAKKDPDANPEEFKPFHR